MQCFSVTWQRSLNMTSQQLMISFLLQLLRITSSNTLVNFPLIEIIPYDVTQLTMTSQQQVQEGRRGDDRGGAEQVLHVVLEVHKPTCAFHHHRCHHCSVLYRRYEIR